MNLEQLTLDIEQSTEIKADIGDVYKRTLHRLGEGNAARDGTSLNMILEEWAGGRWFRDRGEGIQHLWGHVQVIKPPVLIELSGPMFMSYPAINHLEIKLEKIAGGTNLTLRHRAIGMIADDHRQGIGEGWKKILEMLKADFPEAAKAIS
ncbi:MAG TPA: SRPBCC domain-containing protein [Pyrinomonadaceae bacterium]|nr:SRPBCC domain-containing protein [Pyrinomonadaceae bacterium]